MKEPRGRGYAFGALVSLIAAVLQVVGLARYLDRLPGDWVGIALYGITIVAFSLAAFGFYTQARRERG